MKHRENILRLRAEEGKSYNEIVSLLGCSKGTVAYHCGKGQKHKALQRHRRWRKNSHPYITKIGHFTDNKKRIYRKPTLSDIRLLQNKIRDFCKGENMSFTVQDVIDKFGENPICYLTGKPIDVGKPRTYHFDHILPRKRGGVNTIDNLGICTRHANMAKNDMTLDEFIAFCKSIVAHQRKGQESNL